MKTNVANISFFPYVPAIRQTNFLINIGPDDRGLLPDADVERILELGVRIKSAYGTPANFSDFEKQGDTYSITHNEAGPTDEWNIPKETNLTNCVVIEEDLTNGQKVESFSIYGYLPRYRHKKILLFLSVR